MQPAEDRCGDKIDGKSDSVSFSWILFHFTILTYLILFIFLFLPPLTWSVSVFKTYYQANKQVSNNRLRHCLPWVSLSAANVSVAIN